MKTVDLLISIIMVAATLLVSGCFMTMEQRWESRAYGGAQGWNKASCSALTES